MILCDCEMEGDGRVVRVGGRHPPPPEGNQVEGIEGRSGLRRME